MDFSKTALQDLDTKKTDKFLNENKNQNVFLIPDSDNYDLEKHPKTGSHYQQMEFCDDKQNAMCLKNKPKEPSKIRNLYSNTCDLNIGYETKTNDNSDNMNSKVEEESAVEDVLKSSSFCSIPNLCDKPNHVVQLKNDNKLTSSNVPITQEPNKNFEKSVMFQKELKRDEVLEEEETIEKIAEMIAIGSNENNPKTKKRLQILMSQNYTEQDSNSCVKNASSNSNTETNIQPIPIKEDDFDAIPNKQKRYVKDSQKIIEGSESTEAKIEKNESFEETSRFEEVEDKLEEMFAGIEDEQLTNDNKNPPAKELECTDKYIKINSKDNGADNKKIFSDNFIQNETLINTPLPLPTKAAKKSAISFLSNENRRQVYTQLDQKNPTIPKSRLYLKTMPPRRRLSVGMNTELLKFSVDSNDGMNKIKGTNNDLISENCITSHPLKLETQELKKVRNNDVAKNKIKNNNQRNCSEYKKEITYIKSTNRKNKRKVHKTEAPGKTKQSQQKIKQRRMQSLLSSENDNDNEDKPLQTRDIEVKHRSPFILVKGNGSITVVNTVTADDLNEKWTRSKKTSNYVYERKTVKGCHSSTLSNRYDADTADSSWICVLCKIGPHKRGLGDLFGPYVISSDCDEFHSIKNCTEKFQKYPRTDVPFLNFSDKSVKCIKETMSDVENISECSDPHTIKSFTLGMSQISDDCYEVWIHEECAIWAPNIFVVGSRLAGLEDATWSSMRYECEYCLQRGALLCCLQRECKSTSHVPCAREWNWLLDESRFWTYCSKHALRKL